MSRSQFRPEDLYAAAPGSPPETLANLEAIPIRENGEPLVELRRACPGLILAGGPLREPLLLVRRGVAERLQKVQAWLERHHPGYRLRIGDAYRAPEKQTRLFRLLYGLVRLRHPFWPKELAREATAKYIAAPDSPCPPPHTTGGAVDVTLIAPDGRRAALGPWLPFAFRLDCPRLSAAARRNRAILADALRAAGFANYPEEWWHWSYGDSGWALRTGQPAALYGDAATAFDPD